MGLKKLNSLGTCQLQIVRGLDRYGKENFYFESSKIHMYHFITIYLIDFGNKKIVLNLLT